MYKIAIVEDDETIRKELATLLENDGYTPVLIDNFENVVEIILDEKPHLVLLDINIPYMNGETVLQNIRKKSNVPIIMVTSRDTVVDEALSISYGADDYITKPYNPNILLLRIGAVLKRTSLDARPMYDAVEIDLQRGTIKDGAHEETLTKNEMLIFSLLLENRGRITTRECLMTALWNNAEYVNDNALTVYVSRIRAKLSYLGHDDAIETRKGIGYILK